MRACVLLPACLHGCSWCNHTNTRALPMCRFTVSKRYGGVSVAPWDDTGSGSGSGSATYKWLIVGPRSWQHKTNTQAHFGVQLERVQVPLLHAWAISIHKSQVCSLLHDTATLIDLDQLRGGLCPLT